MMFVPREILKHADLKGKICLEIGTYEGKTAKWFLSKGALRVICIDPWLETYLPDFHEPRWNYFKGQYQRFLVNTRHVSDALEVYRGFSQEVYGVLEDKYRGSIDCIYIDGDHREEAVYCDGKMYLSLLKPLGIMCFDDYKWGYSKDKMCTKRGIDRFLVDFADAIDVLHKNSKVIVRKR